MIVVERENVARLVRQFREEHAMDTEYDEGYRTAMQIVEVVLAIVPAYDLDRLKDMPKRI